MPGRVLFSAFFALVLSMSVVHAASITVSVVQTENAPVVAIDMSRTIEDEILGLFFNSGHIVTNAEIRFDGSLFNEKVYVVKEAAFGYSDYLIVLLLTYGPAEKQLGDTLATYAELITVTWKLVDVQTSEKFAEKTVDVEKIKVTDSDPYKRAREMVGLIFPDMLKAVEKFKMGGKN